MERQQKVKCCTWLADEKANVVSVDRSGAIQEVAGKLHHDGQLCKLL